MARAMMAGVSMPSYHHAIVLSYHCVIIPSYRHAMVSATTVLWCCAILELENPCISLSGSNCALMDTGGAACLLALMR